MIQAAHLGSQFLRAQITWSTTVSGLSWLPVEPETLVLVRARVIARIPWRSVSVRARSRRVYRPVIDAKTGV